MVSYHGPNVTGTVVAPSVVGSVVAPSWLRRGSVVAPSWLRRRVRSALSALSWPRPPGDQVAGTYRHVFYYDDRLGPARLDREVGEQCESGGF